MDNRDWNKMFQEKLKNANVKVVAPSFDEAATWEEIANRLPKEKGKVVALPIWIRYAALLLVGLLSGIAISHLSSDGNVEKGSVVTANDGREAPQPNNVRDTVFIEKEPAIAKKESRLLESSTIKRKAIAAQSGRKSKTFHAIPSAPIIVSTQNEQLVKNEDSDREEEKQPTTQMAAYKAAPTRAVHLLDLKGHIQTALIDQPRKKTNYEYLSYYIPTNRLQDLGADQFSKPGIRGVFP